MSFFYMIRDMLSLLFGETDKKRFMEMKLNQDRLRFIQTSVQLSKNAFSFFTETVKNILDYFKESIGSMVNGPDTLK